MLGGSLKASAAACSSRRMVYLWSGRKRLGSKRATTRGAFTFKVATAWRRRSVHATVRVLNTKTVTCKAGSSASIRASVEKV